MNRRAAIGVVVSAAAIAPRAARAADREIEILTDHWRKPKDLTLRVAEAMPAENYDYKPFAEARSFGGELQHLAQAEGYYLGQLGKGRGPVVPSGDTGKAATTKNLSDNFDWAIAAVGQLTAADLTKTFTPGRGPSMTGLDLLYQAMIHTAHTRGYMPKCTCATKA
jgi:uncharacterized damage-inducible protein DinB